MKTKLIFSFILLFFLIACSNTEEEIIELQSDDGFEQIADFLDQNDVLVLGESTHGSEDIDHLKLELIEYLNQHSNYNVLALESSKAELNYYNSKANDLTPEIIQNEAVADMFRRDSFNQLFEDVYSRSIELEIQGINWQPVVYNNSHFNAYYSENIAKEIAPYNEDSANSFLQNEYRIREISKDTVFIDGYNLPFDELNEIQTGYEKILSSEYFNELDESTREFIKNRITILDGPLSVDFAGQYDNADDDYYSRRGLGMFNNVSELVEDGNKVILWVHNFHILKNPSSVSYPNDEQGEYMAQEFNSLGLYLDQADFKTYMIGVYFNQANQFDSLYFENEDLEHITDENYLEGILSGYDKEKIFIDLDSAEWSKETLNSYHEGFIEQQFIPREQYDGIIYIDKIEN
ncbi:Erythromycin esterase [Jeotgalicoccus saudimassiliensis]|uniref:Erythromycin esterase n=1 Tax=Jeotgalicoccus saudimassiliensis TaxID=1461582 RepID=A0A078LYC7_9STAP|nr:erythromycin esterase family protein [Jeotgalicoccus saudimassiliensis]CDZ98999.1 Erythromycin esterase [Jeotgalicoccus saudimassiliensis]